MFLWFDALKIKLNLTESNYNHFIDTNTESGSVQLNFQQWNCKSSNDEVNRVLKLKEIIYKNMSRTVCSVYIWRYFPAMT